MRNARCPIEVGDFIYRKHHAQTIPDRIEIKEIWEDDGMFFFKGKYIYHAIGPVFERVFSDIIFRDPNWVIEKKGESKA